MGTPINRLESLWPRSTATETEDGGKDATWSDTAKSWEENLETILRDHPKLAIAAATVVGLALGWLVKRK